MQSDVSLQNDVAFGAVSRPGARFLARPLPRGGGNRFRKSGCVYLRKRILFSGKFLLTDRAVALSPLIPHPEVTEGPVPATTSSRAGSVPKFVRTRKSGFGGVPGNRQHESESPAIRVAGCSSIPWSESRLSELITEMRRGGCARNLTQAP